MADTQDTTGRVVDRATRVREEQEKALAAFPFLSIRQKADHPFALDSLRELIVRRPEGVSVQTIVRLYGKKTLTEPYLHLIRKRVDRCDIDGNLAEPVTESESQQAKFLLDEIFKDRNGGKSYEEVATKSAKKTYWKGQSKQANGPMADGLKKLVDSGKLKKA